MRRYAALVILLALIAALFFGPSADLPTRVGGPKTAESRTVAAAKPSTSPAPTTRFPAQRLRRDIRQVLVESYGAGHLHDVYSRYGFSDSNEADPAAQVTIDRFVRHCANRGTLLALLAGAVKLEFVSLLDKPFFQIDDYDGQFAPDAEGVFDLAGNDPAAITLLVSFHGSQEQFSVRLPPDLDCSRAAQRVVGLFLFRDLPSDRRSKLLAGGAEFKIRPKRVAIFYRNKHYTQDELKAFDKIEYAYSQKTLRQVGLRNGDKVSVVSEMRKRWSDLSSDRGLGSHYASWYTDPHYRVAQYVGVLMNARLRRYTNLSLSGLLYMDPSRIIKPWESSFSRRDSIPISLYWQRELPPLLVEDVASAIRGDRDVSEPVQESGNLAWDEEYRLMQRKEAMRAAASVTSPPPEWVAALVAALTGYPESPVSRRIQE